MQPALCSVSYSSSYHHLSAEGRLRSCRIQNFAAGSWLSRELRVLLGQVICFFLGHTWPQFCVRGTTGPNLAISKSLPSWFCVLLFFIFWQKADQGNGKCQSYRSQVIGGGLLIEQFASWVGHMVKSSQVTALDTNTKKHSFWCLARVVLGSVL